MSDGDDSSDTEEESKTGAREGLNLDSRRRSVLKAAGAGLGLSALGGSAVSTAGASHDSTTFQVDLVNSTPANLKDPLDETGNYYSDDSTLIRWVWGDDSNSIAEGGMTKYDGGTFDGATVTTQSGVNIDFSTNTASVEFSVSGGTVDLCLVSYSTPSGASLGWDPSDASGQRIYDLDYGTFGGDGSLSVAVPIKSNAVANHSVESGTLGSPGTPDSWAENKYGGSWTPSYVDTESRTGDRSLKVESASGADSQWQQTGIPVDPLHTYEASGWLKTDGVTNESADKAVAIELQPEGLTTPELTGTNPWTYQQLRFVPPEDSIDFRFRFGYFGEATGTAWYDDAGIRKIVGQDPDFGLEAKYTLDGTTATNSVTGVDATEVGSGSPTKEVPGFVNDAFAFSESGSNDRSSTTDALVSGNDLPINGPEATVAAWFRYTTKEDYARVFQVGGDETSTPGSTGGYNLEFDTATDDLRLNNWDTGTKNTEIGRFTLSPDTWYFLVVVEDGDDARYHVFDKNGELSGSPVTGSGARTQSGSESLILMGGDHSDPAGKMDEVRAYSRAFTESEVWRLYQSLLDGHLQGDRRAYYSLDGSTATNADTGTDAIENGSPTSGETGILNSAFSFDHTNNDGLKSGDPLALNGTQATVGAWVNVTGKNDFGRIYQVGGDFASPPSTGWQTRFDGGNDNLLIETRGGGFTERAKTDALSTNTWYFVVTVLDEPGDEGRIHVYDQNGELSNSPYTDTVSGANWTKSGFEPLILMTGGDSPGQGTSGRMDEVYAYASALSQSEVDTLYNDSTSS